MKVVKEMALVIGLEATETTNGAVMKVAVFGRQKIPGKIRLAATVINSIGGSCAVSGEPPLILHMEQK
jgi:hypothetical protein